MHSAKARKKYGTDINRYLGVEFPEDWIRSRESRPRIQRNASSSFSFRDSLTKVFSSASTVSDMVNRQSGHSGSVRRWRNKSTSSALAPETPLKDRTNTMKTSSAASPNSTTFLPELHSTPPMPTFQKPAVASPRSPTPRAAAPRSVHGSLRRDSEALPPISDSGRLLSNPGTKVGPALVDRVEDTPPLPGGWTQQHDLAICVLDARNYSLQGIVTKIRRTFPSLRGVLTPAMIDKRLRQLDQDVEIDYWRIGLHGTKNGTGSAPRIGSGLTSETVTSRYKEPTLKTTVSGSLVKSQSVSNLLTNTMSFSGPSTSTPRATTHDFLSGYRTHAI